MNIPRKLWFLATIVGLSHAGIFEDVGSTIFGEEFTEVENKVIDMAKWANNFYNNYKTYFEGAEILLLVGTGLGEAEMFAEIRELYASGAFEAMFKGAIELVPDDVQELKSVVKGMFTALESLKSLASTDAVATIAEATAIDVLSPWIEKFASSYVLEKYPLTSAQLVILLCNLIGTSSSNINTPEVACKMDNILTEYRKRVVNARLEQLQEPNDFDKAVIFYEGKLKAQNKPYNKDGYLGPNGLRCHNGDDAVCFTDKFIRGKNKQICTSWPVCYEDYAGMIRHKAEAAFPTQLFKNVCHKKFLKDQTDGNFTILHISIKFITEKIY